jgi:HK97 family phage portal protein
MYDAEIFKSLIPSLEVLTQTVSTGIEDIIYWPMPQSALLTLYHASAEHSRSIQIKAEGAFGGGVMGDKAESFEALCATGSADLFTQLGIDLEVYGNAFLELVRDRRGRILSLSHLPALTMYRHANLYDYVQIVYLPDGKEKITHFLSEQILHLRPPCPYGGFYALPSWIGATGMLELVQAAVDWNKRFFINHAMPEYAIITKGSPLSESQKEVAKDFFQREYKGIDNAHRTLLLHLADTESSIEFKALTRENKDGDFLNLLDATKERIHIAHGVPPRMLGIISAGSLACGAELSAQLFSFEKLTLMPKRRRMCDQLRPIFKELNLGSIEFKGLDLTPPEQDNYNITNWAQLGIISNTEARALLQVDERQGLEKSLLELLKKL